MHVDEDDPVETSLGHLLIERGKLDAAGLDRASRLWRGSGGRLHVILTQLGLVTEHDMAEALAVQLDLPLVRSADYPGAPVLEDTLEAEFLKEFRVVPLAETADGLSLAMADPLDAYAVRAIEFKISKPVLTRVAVPVEVEAAIERLYAEAEPAVGQIAGKIGEGADEGIAHDAQHLKELASEAPVIRLVNRLIGRAVEARASDIHIEPFESRLRLRYRIDGVLREEDAPPSRLHAAIVSRVKIMAKLSIAERRLPQDGRMKLVVRGKEIDVRVSTLPTMHGEKVGLRILDRGNVALDLAALGFEGELLRCYLEVLGRPQGILLVAGPTGSGKTTTLYASLLRLNTPEKNILSVEDPIEYQLEGVNQVQVMPQIGLSFANVLRSLLRQDPDIMMVGEIRDLETAEIAVRAALTGHLVLSTVHTNNAATTVTRLLDMGVEDYLLTSTMSGAVSQRLVRTLCPHCQEPFAAPPELVERLRLDRFDATAPITLYRAHGCSQCSGSGYLGRTAIAEMLVMTDAIRRRVLKHAAAHEIHQTAVGEGMQTMYENGVHKALAGTTTLEEVLRVTRDM